jgi:dihydroxyacetone kinase-like protein
VGSDGVAGVPSVTVVTVTDAWLRCTARAVHERRLWLTELDAAIGDGDHGINLDRGFAALLADLDAGAVPAGDAGAQLTSAGRRLLGLVGGASGALYGRALMTAGSRLTERTDDAGIGRRELVELALAGAIDGITALGRAVPGDKTMLDSLVPALDALRAAAPDSPVQSVMLAMADAAETGAAATIPLVARKGRASYLGERSAGHLDPGAASSAILIRCLAHAVTASDVQPMRPGEASAQP